MDALGEASRRRAILDDPDFGEDEVFCGNAECIKRTAGGPVDNADYCCEAAGATFSRRFDFAGQEAAGPRKAKEDASNDDESEAGEEYGKGKGSPKAAGGKLKVSDLLKDVDLYKLLGVAEAASQDELKKAYRHLVLTAHPDKMDKDTDEATAKKAQDNFVKIQEAYELLSDPQKRMQYDSSLDFDDSLPRFKASEGENFYKVFGEVFKRNARFSTKRPVPDIGDADTKPEVWKKFYEFWYGFSSWRDPIVLAQQNDEELYDLEDAEDRYERRAMSRENERVARKYRQAEKDRISELVRLAEKHDPRIAAEKEAKKQARQAEAARKEEERMAVQRKREEAERVKREAEEAERAAEAERRAKEKAARELIKGEVKKLRQRLRGLHSQMAQFVLLDQLNEVCLQFEQEQLKTLGDNVEKALKKGAESGAALIHEAIESIGMKPVTSVKAADEDLESTSSGQSSEELDPEELKRREEAAKKAEEARKERQKRAAEEKAKQEAERAIREAEKAEEKKKRDAEKKKEQEALLVKKRQEEKKEAEKAKKAAKAEVEKAEKDKLKKEQQREEAARKAAEQAEKDKAEAAAKKAEMESERVAQMFATDRIERLGLLDASSEDVLSAELQQAVEADPSIGAALLKLKEGAEAEVLLDRAMALVHKVGPMWPLGLLGPPEVKLPNAVRNRVKKARQQLRDTVTTFLAKGQLVAGAALSEWQQGIVDGTMDIPVWSPEEREEEERAAKAAKEEADAQSPKKGKKGKKEQPKGGEEDLDALLAEFGVDTSAAKKGGKKKK